MITLRDATSDDTRQVWMWANDPSVRSVSFHPSQIPWSEHERWFAGRLSDSNCRLLIVVEDGLDVGQIRFECADSEVEVHVSVAASARGRGVGALALAMACERVAEAFGRRPIVARVMADNIASQRAFEKAGFARAGAVDVSGSAAARFVRE